MNEGPTSVCPSLAEAGLSHSPKPRVFLGAPHWTAVAKVAARMVQLGCVRVLARRGRRLE